MAGALQAIGWAFLPTLIWPVLHLCFGSKLILQDISRALIRTIDSAVFVMGESVKWLLPLLVLSVAASVVALSIFGVTTTKWLESAKYFQAITIMLGAAPTLLASQHVRVDIFHTRMTDRGKARVELLGFYLLLMPACLLLIWNAQSFVGLSWSIREGSPESDGFRGVYLLKTLIPVFAVTMLIQGLAITTRAAMCLRGQSRPARPTGIAPFFRTSAEDTL